VKRRKAVKLWLVLLATSLPLMWIGWRYSTSQGDLPPLPHSVMLKLSIDGARDQVELVQNDDGSYRFLLPQKKGGESLSPDQLADRMYRQQSSRGFFESLFNISSPIGILWVAVGLIGQVLFTGRMVVQWLASEKNRKSVVPPLFWWMSLVGSVMLLSYFLWRRDVVGVLGQSFGLFIYLRNLHLIYRERRSVSIAADPAPEPELN
jgi:lipid-A-disaccharide synthase-like uncharacterized protein